MITAPNFIPTDTDQLNKTKKTYRASLALKSILVISSNDISVPQDWPWSVMEQAPEQSWSSFPRVSGTIVSP